MSQNQRNSKVLATAKMEWGSNMEREVSLHLAPDPFNKATEKGRCRRCWGGLIGREDDSGAMTGLKCLICGKILEGSAAQKEKERMSNESGRNIMNMLIDGHPKYEEDGIFAYKIFPHMGSLSEEEIRKRIRASAAAGGGKQSKLTRADFKAGSPGFLYFQASILMAGLGQTISRVEKERSVVHFPDSDFKDDGSAVVYPSLERLGMSSKQKEFELLGNMGSTMSYSLFSAFACELVMKAISLTCKNETVKSHDLLSLFNDLPAKSRGRIQVDYPEIEEVMDQQRHTFGKWRYFESSVGGDRLTVMADITRARALGKAARVILDEAAFVGLEWKVKVDAKETVTEVGKQKSYDYEYEIAVTGSESPPRP